MPFRFSKSTKAFSTEATYFAFVSAEPSGSIFFFSFAVHKNGQFIVTTNTAKKIVF